jgi:hypothetical protein
MRHLRLTCGLFSVLGLVGCAIANSPITGVLYKDIKYDGLATEAYGGSAKGEACVSSILGIFASGDASVDAAKKAGNIAQVVAVDHSTSNILTFYAKYCTIVYGKRAAGPGAPAAAPAAATPAKPAG